jgi:hypothetical protein
MFLLHRLHGAAAEERAHRRADLAHMAKQFVVLIRPQFHGDAHHAGGLVLRVGHLLSLYSCVSLSEGPEDGFGGIVSKRLVLPARPARGAGFARSSSAFDMMAQMFDLHHRLKRRRAKHHQGFDGPAPVTEVSVNLKVDVQRVRLDLCQRGLGAAYRARV